MASWYKPATSHLSTTLYVKDTQTNPRGNRGQPKDLEKAEHRCYLANTENNLGLLYYAINRCEEAHKHLDNARRVLISLRDVSGVAQVDETRAGVFLKQGRVEKAERVACSAVRVQEKGGSNALLAEALITHGRRSLASETTAHRS